MKRSDVVKGKHKTAFAVWTLQGITTVKEKAGFLRYPQTKNFSITQHQDS